MMNKRNILIGIVIIVFGLVFVPRVIDRVKNNDISRSESRSLKLDNFEKNIDSLPYFCLLYTSPSPRDREKSRMPSSA